MRIPAPQTPALPANPVYTALKTLFKIIINNNCREIR